MKPTKTSEIFEQYKKLTKTLEQLNGLLIDKDVWIEEGAQIIGPVIIGKNVKILRNAIVKGPIIIGDGTIIGNGCFIRQSIIGKKCIVGFNTEIVRSMIGDGCTFHTNFIGDSVIGNDNYFGYASCTSTVRLDDDEIILKERKLGIYMGKNCRIGSFVNFMPGINIGDNCHIAPNSIIDRAIPHQSFVKPIKTCLIIQKNNKSSNPSSRNIFNKKLLKDIERYRTK